MLKHLSITNYAIIENLELNFNNGFTVITGETGAGKSILLGALSLILGQRADTTALNDKSKKCIVEGEFEFEKEEYHEFFEANDLDYEFPSLIRREISAKGKSRAFINDTPVSLVVLKELMVNLIDIHSQHQTLQVQNNRFQINVVDSFAGLNEEVSGYKEKYNKYQKDKAQLEELKSESNKAKSDEDYISFQIKEIEELGLKPNEKKDIQEELEIINNLEEIKFVLESSGRTLINSEHNLLAELQGVAQLFLRISNCSGEYSSIQERLSSISIELEDVAREIENCNDNLNFDQENAAFLNERLSQIFFLEQKHNLSSSDELLSLLQEFKSRVVDANAYEERIVALEEQVQQQQKELQKIAKKISTQRVNKFPELSKEITDTLTHLGMPDAMFEVDHHVLPELNEVGIDEMTFLFTANKGVGLSELSKVASGGELSRLMLTVKSILARNNKLSSIIFDEIDAGVSGDIADKMASMMKQISEHMQVIAITHLPQVAAKGERHFRIYKENVEGKTHTHLTVLNRDERVEELAKMLSGEKLSDAARENALSLLVN